MSARHDAYLAKKSEGKVCEWRDCGKPAIPATAHDYMQGLEWSSISDRLRYWACGLDHAMCLVFAPATAAYLSHEARLGSVSAWHRAMHGED